MLTTMSDNSVMWVYFNVPERRYLEYMGGQAQDKEDQQIGLRLASGNMFPESGKIGAIEAQFNNETGNIPFRADFANPNRLLRHGQTGTIVISRTHTDAIVIPQRAVFEILAKRYVFVIEDAKPDAQKDSGEGSKHDAHGPVAQDELVPEQIDPDQVAFEQAGHEQAGHEQAGHEQAGHEQAGHSKAIDAHGGAEAPQHGGDRGVVRQREIVVRNELEDIYVIESGLDINDKIILEGIRQVRDGDEVEYEFHAPEEVLGDLKYHAE